MFDDEWWPPVSQLTAPPLEAEWRPWDTDDTDTWIDELAALDPDRPRTVAELLHAAEHGPVEQIPLARLAQLDPASLSDTEQVALAVAAQRLENHAVGVRMRAAAAFAGPDPADDRGEAAFAWTDITAALVLGEGAGRNLVHHARRLAADLPATLAAMLDGQLSWPKARTLLDASETFSPQQCAELEDRVLPKAGERNHARHADRVRYHAHRVDPDGYQQRRRERLADVALVRYHHGDGVADVLAKNVDDLSAQTLWDGADTWARQAKAAGGPWTRYASPRSSTGPSATSPAPRPGRTRTQHPRRPGTGCRSPSTC